jgi:Zn-dependent membrane protease YugP
MFVFDPMWFLFMVPPFIFMIHAQARVYSAFKKCSRVANMQRLSGVEAVESLLRVHGLDRVRVERAKGQLTDHYDPRHNVLRLSAGVYSTPSVASLGIVAHEIGHAVQDKTGYAFLRFRTALVPAASLGSQLGWLCIIGGLFLYLIAGAFGLTVLWIGVFLFAAAVLFSLVTLPVEFNASHRARQMLRSTGLVSAREYEGASAVLSAAALTYVASFFQALAQLLYFVLLATGLQRR